MLYFQVERVNLPATDLSVDLLGVLHCGAAHVLDLEHPAAVTARASGTVPHQNAAHPVVGAGSPAHRGELFERGERQQRLHLQSPDATLAHLDPSRLHPLPRVLPIVVDDLACEDLGDGGGLQVLSRVPFSLKPLQTAHALGVEQPGHLGELLTHALVVCVDELFSLDNPRHIDRDTPMIHAQVHQERVEYPPLELQGCEPLVDLPFDLDVLLTVLAEQHPRLL